MSLIPATFADLMTLTRGSSGYRVGSSGYLESISSNNPRIDYDPVTYAVKGLLIENTTTNLFLYSEQFDNAAWSKASTSISANAAAAPTNSVVADSLVENGSTAAHAVGQAISFSSGYKYTFSVFVKGFERPTIQLSVSTALHGSTGTSFCNFNLNDGTVTRIGSNIESASVVAYRNGWYRCIMTTKTTTAGGTYTAYIAASDIADPTTPTPSYLGQFLPAAYLWGAQMERQGYASSYFTTTSVTGVRAADSLILTSTSPWFSSTLGTLYTEFIPVTSISQAVASFDDNTAAEVIKVSLSNSDPYFTVIDNSSTQASLDAGTITSGSTSKMAITFNQNSFKACHNGGTVVTDSSGTLPTITQLQLGKDSQATPTYLNGHLRKIRYYPRVLTDAELVSLTS